MDKENDRKSNREDRELSFREWLQGVTPRMSDFEIKLLQFLEEIKELDKFLHRREDDVDILFLTQSRFLNRGDFIRHLKQELRYYCLYFDKLMRGDDFDEMYDRVALIEEKYGRLVIFDDSLYE